MKFIHRLGFYMGGFVIGLGLLFFFLSGKKTSCDYGPEARTLKNIRLKPRVLSEKTSAFLEVHQLDTTAISILLKDGDVLFSQSNTKLDSCKQYVIEGLVRERALQMRIENCDKKATVIELILLD